MMTRNSELLASFVAYCEANPNQRFWQALRNWSDYNYICVTNVLASDFYDTFYWETKNDRAT